MYFIKLSAYVKIIEDIAIGHFPQSLSRYLSLSLALKVLFTKQLKRNNRNENK